MAARASKQSQNRWIPRLRGLARFCLCAYRLFGSARFFYRPFSIVDKIAMFSDYCIRTPI